MDVSDAVLDFNRDLDVQLSTNIGEDQLLFRRSDSGTAIEKSPYEIAGKAAQAAIGVSASMGTRVHPVNLVKVGLDGMKVPMLKETLSEVVSTLKRTEDYSHSQVNVRSIRARPGRMDAAQGRCEKGPGGAA